MGHTLIYILMCRVFDLYMGGLHEYQLEQTQTEGMIPLNVHFFFRYFTACVDIWLVTNYPHDSDLPVNYKSLLRTE